MSVFDQVEIQKDSDEFMYLQLYKELARLIESGTLKAYDRLPPIRKLADLLEVNTVTVVNAYRMLEEAGLVHKKIGSGTYVSPMYMLDDEGEDDQRSGIRFSLTTPPIELFPVEEFKVAMNAVLDRDGGSAFAYHEGKGFKPLRDFFSRQLAINGVHVSPDLIHIISGVQQGIDVVSKALLNQGDVVMVEGPTYAGALGSFRLRGARIVEMPLEVDGPDMEYLEKLIEKHKPKLYYSIPNFQNPSGITYSDACKARLVELSNQYGFYIVEDDYATDLNFSDRPVMCLKAYDHCNRVIYLKSFSKLFMPGLRLGFMVSPIELEEAVMLAKHTSDISTSGFVQRVFDAYIKQGGWEKQYRTVIRTMRARYEAAAKHIEDHLPKGCVCDIPQGGINFWIGLPEDFDTTEFYKRLSSKNIHVVAGESFYSDGRKSRYFRLSVAGVDEREIAYGLEQLFESVEEVRSPKRLQRAAKQMRPII